VAYEDTYRLSSHAVITDQNNHVLLLKASYNDLNWGLPGGALDVGETIHEALIRECREELNCDINIEYLSGVYYHSAYNSQAFIFKCALKNGAQIELSSEHTDYRYSALESLSKVQRIRVSDCLNYSGATVSAKF